VSAGGSDYVKRAREVMARKRAEGAASKASRVRTRNGKGTGPAATTVLHRASDAEVLGATKKYEKIVADERGMALLARSIESEREVAVDLETFPPGKALDPRRGRIRLISVAAARVNAIVDVTRVDPGPLLEVLKHKRLIFHNGKFDLSFMRRAYGFEHEGEVVDTMILHRLLHFATGKRVKEGGKLKVRERGLPQALADVVHLYLGEKLEKSEQASDWSAPTLSEEQLAYALKDSAILLRLKDAMLERILELGMKAVAELEGRALLGMTWCEDSGIALDEAEWLRLADEAEDRAARAKAELDAAAPEHPDGKGWNWGSPAQVARALELLGFDTDNLPKTAGGRPSTTEEALKRVANPPDAVTLARAMLRYRAAEKHARTYGRKWVEPPRFRPKAKKHRWDKRYQWFVNGRIHTSFTQVVGTGRMASSEPNIQNLPNEGGYREAFRAPEGRALVVADYSQMELLLAAVIAPEPAMLEALENGEDLHTKTARAMLRGKEVSAEELKEYRRRAKAVNFGFLYGLQPKSFVRYARVKYDLEVSLEEAEAYKKAFFATYPGLTSWHTRERKKANAGRELARTPLGRMRKVSLAYRPWQKAWGPYFPERVNAPVQGAGADAIKAALALLYETRGEQPGDPFPVDVVHDEVVLEVDAQHAEVAEAWVSGCLVRGARQVTSIPDLPVRVETRIVKSFGEK
jgi:DNA polymerase I-like protein with 3'-5' exonuclease and polymerase domains